MKNLTLRKALAAVMLVLLSLFSNAQITLDLKAYLEGPWNGVIMGDNLYFLGYLPLDQPYNGEPWYYHGNESVAAIPPNVVDWVLVELRETIGDASTATLDSLIYREAAFILRDGKIVGLDGVSLLQCNVTVSANLYVVLRHRNHLGILSGFPLQESGGVYSYDFSNGSNQVYGGPIGHKEISTNVWGKPGGDGNADGQVNAVDKNDIWKQQAGQSGYLGGDFDLNGDVQQQDKNDIWKQNGGKSAQVPSYASANTAPVAVLQVSPPNGSTNTIFDLDGTSSYDNETKIALLAVRWDYDNDGNWDTDWSLEKTSNTNFSQPGTYTVKMEIMDVSGLTDVTSQNMDVTVGLGCEGVDSVIYEGKTYHTVEIGKQCWLKENLDVGTMINGSIDQTDNGTVEKYCYNNDPSNCDTYGGLYEWDEMMQYETAPGIQGICPTGWHVPTDNEWRVLEGNADSRYPVGDSEWDKASWRGFDAGGSLKETGTIYWNSPNTGATNLHGFTALPGGSHHINGNWYSIYNDSHWWTSTEKNASGSIERGLYHDYTTVYRAEYNKGYGFSIRCLRDYINLPPTEPVNPQPANGAIDVDIPNLSWSCSDPNGDIIRYSIYFGTTSNPPLVETAFPTSHYTVSVLNPNTTYFWRVVAVDMHGDSTSGAEWSYTTSDFICGMDVTDTRTFSNGEVYPTVLIGNQCWMAKNLNYGVFTPGASNQTNTGYPERYCYDDSPANCNTYGSLYQWDEMMNYDTVPGVQGICPDGWHIPTDDEWKFLEGTADSLYLIGDPVWDWGLSSWRGYDAGGNMKEAGTTHWSGPNAGATNLTGFTGLPAGYRDKTNGSFLAIHVYNGLWSSNVYDTVVWTRTLHYNRKQIRRIIGNKSYGFSVRCLRNNTGANQPPNPPSNPTPPNTSTNQQLNTALSWSCSDPEGDALLYDIYLETDSIPVLVKANHPDTVYNPGELDAGTTYIWKVVAHDVHGNYTAGPLWSFETATDWACGDPLLDTRDGQSYSTVQIVNQCWMGESLNIGTEVPGTQDMTDDGVIEKYCYGNNTARCDEYGGLYQWNEMMQYSIQPGTNGICPQGWHIPTDEEYKILEGNVDSQFGIGDPEWDGTGWRGLDAGGSLKETGTIHWLSPNTGATNTSGFTALAAGFRDPNTNFYNLKHSVHLWTSNQFDPTWTLTRYLSNEHAGVHRRNDNKNLGFSIRCIEDPTPQTWSCGMPITITHTAGDVAPVDKTVNYGTVETDLTGSNQCWITQNLGADHQAISATDATEESAGWYWQFNRKQGYKHDGTTLTPAWTITSINENSDWQSANDPCSILFGTGWRLPTYTEWYNADANGGWNNRSDTYGSVLKLHGAGASNNPDGSLIDRGSIGYYWSSKQNSSTNGWYMIFSSNISYTHNSNKADGFSSRCLRDYQATWSCGDILNVTHTTGDVAPVDKTVSYGTVETNLTGSNQCWITQNLGADQQATSATDATEESAGWYWQFNRKQGYKHDETTRTPNTTWITPINENSDWEPARDPCTILLGGGWRLPTYTEWYNADTNGGWNNRNDAYNSVLKLHASGYLGLSTGSLHSRSLSGKYWSGTQNSGTNTSGWLLYIYSSSSYMNYLSKENGFSARCLKDNQITWSCGDPLPVTHTAGDVAPVNKTVNYGTVETTLTGSNKCWITQNLGADHQATSATDATEESAGWYWQFNCKQGYKHDGITRTPNNTWITSINENSDWQSLNDPCELQLGIGWRLPTYTEWLNADQNEGWNNRNDVYSSSLKLHPAGYLDNSNGSLLYLRGYYGNYWSSAQESSTLGWNLGFGGSDCNLYNYYKAGGYSIRCLKDIQTSWSCGDVLNVNHIAGDVAPVDKTVSYGTVETTLTGSDQCWITQNLGADHQATSATDATEESAGWYWQFNRKQGYKHDGTTRTPNTTWITSISENNDWQTVNDPCTILFGAGWRLPTYTELNNADQNGGWNNRNDTYASVLKLHAAGYLNSSSGSLVNRGSGGHYWSSTQNSSTAGRYLYIDGSNGYMGGNNKATSFSARCLSDNQTAWSCGDPLQVNHVVGDVAPVNKTVDYGTAETALTGSNQCWITQNLGADHLAISATDATEESAGWYWQFNKKQGYKHDGASRTPNTAWITSINENSDWMNANDPCTLMLGSGWRLPTYAEWNNAYQSGGWNNRVDAYNSILKLHAGGYLYEYDGSLYDRGSYGYYYSSKQMSNNYGWYLGLGNGGCGMYGSPRAFGLTTRCLIDIQTSWSCGDPLQVNHIAGDVAPVDKTVSYGTVETNLSGSNQCWITQNLGSDHQATSATDATEESAGWYWQFNKKQGYKHDGSTRTPNTTWITSINESSDWQAAYDPCSLLHGAGWRLPTYTEWSDADANNSWGNRSDAYASALKLHAAGFLGTSDGSLNFRGSHGSYWSSSRSSNAYGWNLSFDGSNCGPGSSNKAIGFSARCLRD